MSNTRPNVNGLAGFVVTTTDGSLIADINLHDGKIIEVDGYKVIEYTNEDQLLFREQLAEETD